LNLASDQFRHMNGSRRVADALNLAKETDLSATGFPGMPSSITHSDAGGAITGSYDAEGNLIAQSLPGVTGAP